MLYSKLDRSKYKLGIQMKSIVDGKIVETKNFTLKSSQQAQLDEVEKKIVQRLEGV